MHTEKRDLRGGGTSNSNEQETELFADEVVVPTAPVVADNDIKPAQQTEQSSPTETTKRISSRQRMNEYRVDLERWRKI